MRGTRMPMFRRAHPWPFSQQAVRTAGAPRIAPGPAAGTRSARALKRLEVGIWARGEYGAARRAAGNARAGDFGTVLGARGSALVTKRPVRGPSSAARSPAESPWVAGRSACDSFARASSARCSAKTSRSSSAVRAASASRWACSSAQFSDGAGSVDVRDCGAAVDMAPLTSAGRRPSMMS